MDTIDSSSRGADISLVQVCHWRTYLFTGKLMAFVQDDSSRGKTLEHIQFAIATSRIRFLRHTSKRSLLKIPLVDAAYTSAWRNLQFDCRDDYLEEVSFSNIEKQGAIQILRLWTSFKCQPIASPILCTGICEAIHLCQTCPNWYVNRGISYRITFVRTWFCPKDSTYNQIPFIYIMRWIDKCSAFLIYVTTNPYIFFYLNFRNHTKCNDFSVLISSKVRHRGFLWT